MTRDLVVIGAGGFGRETLDVIAAAGFADPTAAWTVLGILDDAPATCHLRRLAVRGIAYLGPVESWLNELPGSSGSTPAGGSAAPVSYVVGVGGPAARERLAARLDARGLRAATLVHPGAGVGSGTELGAGTVVCAGAQVSTNVRLGRHVHVNPNATVGHDTVCEDHVSVNPAATVSGECRIGARTLVGAGAVVLQGLRIGPDAVVGAAACVTRDVAPGVVVTGVPAR